MQATIVGLLAAMAALLLGAVSKGELDFATVKLLCASSVSTAFFAAFALGELCPHPTPFFLLPGCMLHFSELHCQVFVLLIPKDGALMVEPWCPAWEWG